MGRKMVRPRSCCYLCPASTQVSLKQYQQVRQTSGSVNRHICYTQRYTPVWLLLAEITPQYPSQSHDFKKGAKELVFVCCLPSAKHKRGTFTKARQTTCWSWTWRDSISLWSRSLFSLLFQIFFWMEPSAFIKEWESKVTSNHDTYEVSYGPPCNESHCCLQHYPSKPE